MLNETYQKEGCIDSVEFMMEEKVVKPRAINPFSKSSSSAKLAEVKKHFLKKTT